MSEQLVSIVVMCGAGILVGAVIDCYRTGIALLHIKNMIRRYQGILEITLWIALACLSFYLLLVIKGGSWRMIDSLAQLSGIFLYSSIFQSAFRLVGRVFNRLLIRPAYWVLHLAVYLIRFKIRFLAKLLFMIFRPLQKIKKKLFPNTFKKT